ncbi:hypothetical protein LTR86_004169 [Recurvomyces mirabilis]|nr:hypothetical protein LTR86_004169 [Recurvomyces mirabilis]
MYTLFYASLLATGFVATTVSAAHHGHHRNLHEEKREIMTKWVSPVPVFKPTGSIVSSATNATSTACGCTTYTTTWYGEPTLYSAHDGIDKQHGELQHQHHADDIIYNLVVFFTVYSAATTINDDVYDILHFVFDFLIYSSPSFDYILDKQLGADELLGPTSSVLRILKLFRSLIFIRSPLLFSSSIVKRRSQAIR